MLAHHGIYFRQPTETETGVSPKAAEPEPLICLGYVFDKSIVYMGDVSSIPERSWNFLESLRPESQDQGRHSNGNGHGHKSEAAHADSIARTSLESSVAKSVAKLNLDGGVHPSRHSNGDSSSSGTFNPSPSPLILVVDSLWPLRSHTSHYSFPQALDTALRLNADVSYLIGFVHPTTHFIWEELCLSIRGLDGQRDHPDSDAAAALVDKVWRDRQFSGEFGKRLKKWGGKVEPSFDGLKLEIAPHGWTESETRAISL